MRDAMSRLQTIIWDVKVGDRGRRAVKFKFEI
jgi:hypothetical protein